MPIAAIYQTFNNFFHVHIDMLVSTSHIYAIFTCIVRISPAGLNYNFKQLWDLSVLIWVNALEY